METEKQKEDNVKKKIEEIIKGLKSQDLFSVERSLRLIINLSVSVAFRNFVGESAGLAPLFELLGSKNEVLRTLSVWALSNLCVDHKANRDRIRQAGQIPKILDLLNLANNEDSLQKILWLLVNLTVDNNQNRMTIASCGGMDQMITLLSSRHNKVSTEAGKVLRNLFFEKDLQRQFANGTGLALLNNMIGSNEYNLTESAAFLLTMLSGLEESSRDKVMKAGILPKLVNLLGYQDRALKKQITTIIANLALDEKNEDLIVKQGAVGPLVGMLAEERELEVQREVANALSNLSNSRTARGQIYECGGVPHIVRLLSTDDEDMLQNLLALSTNITIDDEPREEFVELGGVEIIQKLVQSKPLSAETKQLAKQAIQNSSLPPADPVASAARKEKRKEKRAQRSERREHRKKKETDTKPQLSKSSDQLESKNAEKRQDALIQLYNQSEMRGKVEHEIITSEESYVRCLSTIIRIYLQPLKQDIAENKKPLLSPQQLKNLFSSIEVIHEVNSKFLATLKTGNTKFSEKGEFNDFFFGLTFQKFIPSLNFYTDYVQNYDLALYTFDLAYKNKKFKEFIEVCDSRSEVRGLNLMALMISVVQRVPRYVLLMEELAKYTPDFHPDVENINDVRTELRKVTSSLDQVRTSGETFIRVLRIQDALTNYHGEPLVVSGKTRRVILEGTFYEKSKRGPKYCHMFLFDDILMQTVQKKYQYKFKRTFAVNDLSVSSLPDNKDVQTFGMQITLAGAEPLTLYTTDKKERDSWVTEILEAIKQIKSNSKSPRGTQSIQTRIFNLKS